MTATLLQRFGRTYAKGEVLFQEDDPGDELFVIHRGAVRVTKRVAGEEKVIAILGAGEFVGELAILNDRPRTATATAIEDTEALVVDALQLEDMVAHSAEIALRLIKKLAKRLDSADALIEVLMHKDVRARMMLGLARHADSFGEVVDDGIRLRIDARDLAREISIEEPLVEEFLKQLERMRLVTREPDGQIVVAEVDRLADFVEFLDLPSSQSSPLP